VNLTLLLWIVYVKVITWHGSEQINKLTFRAIDAMLKSLVLNLAFMIWEFKAQCEKSSCPSNSADTWSDGLRRVLLEFSFGFY
jgi:hypothetical protein